MPDYEVFVMHVRNSFALCLDIIVVEFLFPFSRLFILLSWLFTIFFCFVHRFHRRLRRIPSVHLYQSIKVLFHLMEFFLCKFPIWRSLFFEQIPFCLLNSNQNFSHAMYYSFFTYSLIRIAPVRCFSFFLSFFLCRFLSSHHLTFDVVFCMRRLNS